MCILIYRPISFSGESCRASVPDTYWVFVWNFQQNLDQSSLIFLSGMLNRVRVASQFFSFILEMNLLIVIIVCYIESWCWTGLNAVFLWLIKNYLCSSHCRDWNSMQKIVGYSTFGVRSVTDPKNCCAITTLPVRQNWWLLLVRIIKITESLGCCIIGVQAGRVPTTPVTSYVTSYLIII